MSLQRTFDALQRLVERNGLVRIAPVGLGAGEEFQALSFGERDGARLRHDAIPQILHELDALGDAETQEVGKRIERHGVSVGGSGNSDKRSSVRSRLFTATGSG